MAAGLRGLCLLLSLLPLVLADAEPPCEGFRVLAGLAPAIVEESPQLGVKVLRVMEDVEADETCWKECCHTEACDLAFTTAQRKCYVTRCRLHGFDMSELTAQEGANTFRREDLGVKPQREDFCLPKNDSGSCRASFPRWWYDTETGTCKNFTYGGCPANLNNHAGEEECMKKCSGVIAKTVDNPPAPQRQVADPKVDDSEICSGPAVVGRCRAAFPRWFFDSNTKVCRQFTYGGCGGNKNNHLSEQDCVDKCIVKKQAPTSKGSFKEYCAAPAYTGNCRAAFRRFYYDPSEGKCKSFVYGGCNANKNNYMKEEDCLKMCSGRSEDDDHAAEHNVFHRPLTSVILPIFLPILAAFLLGVMIVFFVKMARNSRQDANFRAMWNPIDDKECLMNNAYSL